MSNNFELIGLFPIPVIKIKFEDHYKYNFPEVEKKDNKPDDWNCSVYTTFPNIQDDDPIVSPSVRDSLMSDLTDTFVKVFLELNIPNKISMHDFWYNIYHDNQGQEQHAHLPEVGGTLPFWSGIYYNKNPSPTNFIRSDITYRTHLFPGYDKTALASPLAAEFSPDVEDGDILLFPPYLLHSVKSLPKHKNKMRMTFSFNIYINS